MIARLRQILPQWSTLACFAATFLFLEGPILYFEWKIGRRILELRVRPGIAIIYVTAGFYGIHRAVTLHPFYNVEYRKWLELTPWTIHKPLPLGPIALVLEDALLLGCLILLALTQPLHQSIRVVNVFLIIHCLLLAASFWSTGVGTIGYLTLFWLGLAVRLWASPWACFAVAAAVYLVVYEGLWRSLERFPWRGEWSWTDTRNRKVFTEKLLGPPCGWPYDRLFRDVESAERFRLRGLDAILISMLAGWWIFCLTTLIPDPRARVVPGLLAPTIVTCTVPMSRFAMYVNYYWPPIGLLGRIRTGRWIIPGYDRCLVGPMLAVLAGGTVAGLCREAHVPVEISGPIIVTTVILVTLITPPGLREWFLTGKHRIVSGPQARPVNSEFVKVG